MDQITVGTVDLDSVHASAGGACSSGTKGFDGFVDLLDGELARNDVMAVPLQVSPTGGCDHIVTPKVGFSMIGVRSLS